MTNNNVSKEVYYFQSKEVLTDSEYRDFINQFNKIFPTLYKKYLSGQLSEEQFSNIAVLYILINYPATKGVLDGLKRIVTKIKNGYNSTGNTGYWERLGEWLRANDYLNIGIFLR